MTKSKQSKLYPLFRQASNLSTAANIDISNDSSASDGNNDEDDLPLTCLLMRSKPKNPPTRRSRSELSKSKKGKKRFASAVTVDTRIAENKDPCSTESKKRKQKKNMGEPAIQSNDRGASISITSNAIANVTPDHSASIAKDACFSESECNGIESYDAETIATNFKDKGFSPKSRKSTHESGGNQRRKGRFYSDTAMDFVGPYQSQAESNQPHGPKIRNVAHKLNRRIANGGCLSQHPHNRHYSPFSKARIIQNKLSSISSSYCWPNKWKIPSWISLEQPSMGNNNRGIDHITWDPMGVLLAVAIDKIIFIYDWDMFRAADLQGRSDRARNCQESEFKIPPIVIFRLPHPVASLVWNPFEMDELAVGFR